MPAEQLQRCPMLVELPDEASVDQARRLLEEATIAPDDIELVGTRGEAVSSRTGLSAQEHVAMRDLIRRLLIGGAIGVVLGGVIGAILAGAIDADRTWAIVGGAIIGLLGGALVGGVEALGKQADEVRVEAAHPEFANPVLGVRNATPEQVERAEAALQEMTTVRIIKRWQGVARSRMLSPPHGPLGASGQRRGGTCWNLPRITDGRSTGR
jgi:hypothetical protein